MVLSLEKETLKEFFGLKKLIHFRSPEEKRKQDEEELRRREELKERLERERLKKLTKKKKINL